MNISGWGKFPKHNSKLSKPYNLDELFLLVKNDQSIARGNGRAYGDSAINKKNTIISKNFNKMISFNDGCLVAESGVLLKDIIDTFLPRGWFPSVSPGTKYVTVGGMVAANVHGKNHHNEGSFYNFINWIELIDKNNDILRISKDSNKELFDWTVGGMGLTGFIYRVSFNLKKVGSSWIKQRSIITKNLEETLDVFDKVHDSTYSVAWIDCLSGGKNLGRSIVIIGEHAEKKDLTNLANKKLFNLNKKNIFSIYFNFPKFILNPVTVKLFNIIIYFKAKYSRKELIVDWDKFFYPLDKILGWNKIYGKRGFIQFQCVIPLENAKEGLTEILKKTYSKNIGSFLTVLKKFGEGQSGFSFPMPGYTLAMDFPVSRKVLLLLEELDEIVIKHKGRFYLAKDSRMTSHVLKKTDERYKQFKEFRKKNMFEKNYNSEQSLRLDI
tara:strand:+ start:1229 stop:2545 length:1317 start_codon:yes stop_codon:yes gene_type:complete